MTDRYIVTWADPSATGLPVRLVLPQPGVQVGLSEAQVAVR